MATTGQTTTLIALFESRASAERAVGAMLDAGYPAEDISIVAGSRESPDADIPKIGPLDDTIGKGEAGRGAAIGGLAGFIGGLVALAIPGIGPVLAAGPLAAGIMGAGIGAATGGVVGALKERGVPEDDATNLSEAIRHGRVMVSAYVASDRADAAADILDHHGALDIDDTAANIRPQETPNPIRPLSPEAVEAARVSPGEGLADRVRGHGRRTRMFPGFTGFGPASTT